MAGGGRHSRCAKPSEACLAGVGGEHEGNAEKGVQPCRPCPSSRLPARTSPDGRPPRAAHLPPLSKRLVVQSSVLHVSWLLSTDTPLQRWRGAATRFGRVRSAFSVAKAWLGRGRGKRVLSCSTDWAGHRNSFPGHSGPPRPLQPPCSLVRRLLMLHSSGRPTDERRTTIDGRRWPPTHRWTTDDHGRRDDHRRRPIGRPTDGWVDRPTTTDRWIHRPTDRQTDRRTADGRPTHARPTGSRPTTSDSMSFGISGPSQQQHLVSLPLRNGLVFCFSVSQRHRLVLLRCATEQQHLLPFVKGVDLRMYEDRPPIS